MNPRPRLFIGSSSKDIVLAEAVQQNLASSADVVMWGQGIFAVGGITLDAVLTNFRFFDFGVFILSMSAVKQMANHRVIPLRDNMLFELGAFMGVNGKERSFLLVPDGVSSTDLPSDLHGFTFTRYDSHRQDIRAALGPACTEIRTVMEQRGPVADYHIVNRKSGKALDVSGWGIPDHVELIQYTYHGGANQRWVLRALDNQHYAFFSANTLKCLQVRGPTDQNGEVIEQAEFQGSDNQQWVLVRQGDGTYWIRSRYSHKYMAVKDGSIAEKAAIVQYDLGNGATFNWWVKKIF